MGREEIPRRVRHFLARHITSVEELEVLLMLRAVPDKAWSAEEIRRALSGSEDSINVRLDHLRREGLVDADEPKRLFRYAVDPSQESVVTELAETYAKRRVAVIATIFAGPSDSVRSFSDAFKVRDDE